MTAVAGAVLIGGRSSRLGRDKAVESIGGEALATRIIAALSEAGCVPVFAVGHSTPEREALGIEFVADRWPGSGPLNGVLTAVTRIEGPVVVAACDLVAVRPETIARLIEAAAGVDVAMATSQGRHGMVGCWNHSAIPTLEDSFRRGVRSLWQVLEELTVREIVVDAAELADIDTDEDLVRYRRSVGC